MEQKGILDLADIEPGHIKEHYAYLLERPNQLFGGALSLYTITGYLFLIRLLLSWAVQSGQISSSPMESLRFPTPPPAARAIVTKEEIQDLYAICVLAQERLTLSLFYGCGLRASEGSRLNLKDIDQKARLLYVRQGKGRKRRVIPLTVAIAEDIKNYIYEQRVEQITRLTKGLDQKALSLNKVGTRMSAQSYWRLFKELLQRLGDPELINQGISLHSLRHSIATHLLADGMPLERVRDFLGHDHLETTQLYTHLKTDEL
jgi:integrase/recombinase XerD